MYLHMFGNGKRDKIVLLHPLGLNGTQIYQMLGTKFQGEYCFISPDMGNHGAEKREFTSVGEEAKALHQFLVQQDYTEIKLLYGASLGAICAMQLLQFHDLEFDAIYLDGVPLTKLSFMKRNLFSMALMLQKNQILDDREKGMRDLIKHYGRELSEDMADSFEKYEDDSLKNIAKAFGKGEFYPVFPDIQERMYFEWGEKEQYLKKSLATAESSYPKAHVTVREGCEHCEYMATHQEEYAAYIEGLITTSAISD